MINPRLFREKIDLIVTNLQKRSQRSSFNPEQIAARAQEISEIQPTADGLKNERNRLTKFIGEKKKNNEDARVDLHRMQEISKEIKKLDEDCKEKKELNDKEILGYPNILLDDVPIGKDEGENSQIAQHGEIPHNTFKPLSHDILGEKLGIIDFASGSKISGTKFPLYRGDGALLERAIINFMLDTQTRENGYTETFVPLLVNDQSMVGTGQFPKFMDEYYRLDKDGLSLIPTAEVPLTNLYRDSIIDAKDLPVKITAASSCFRREAGSYGKETRGLVRVHQFQKVELVKICAPEESASEHELLLKDAQSILNQLNLPYRIMLLCSGDTSLASAKTYDLEVWMPGLGKYLEISSVSNFTDFQARRAKIRFRRDKKSKPELVHTLNGSGLAAGRTMAAIMENFQQEDGSIKIPEPLQKYMNGKTIINRNF